MSDIQITKSVKIDESTISDIITKYFKEERGETIVGNINFIIGSKRSSPGEMYNDYRVDVLTGARFEIE